MAGYQNPSLSEGDAFRRLLLLVVIITYIWFSNAIADDSQPESIYQNEKDFDKYEIGIEIGALVFIGTDFRIFYHKANSPWLFGIRYLDIEDDFVNESAYGLPGDESDKEYTERMGVYVDYLFNPEVGRGSYYLSGALMKTTNTITCNSESDSDSTTGLYFGGGYRGSFGNRLGYNIGLLLSPFINYELETFYCSSSSDGDFDVNASLTFRF